MQESSLHRSLKEVFSSVDSRQEVWVDGYLVDVSSGNQIIEIQTGSFYKIKPKLEALLPTHQILLVHPIAREKWICRRDGQQVRRRRSPRRGRFEDLYYELVGIPRLLVHPNLTLEVIFIQVEEIWQNDGRGSWRRKGWSIVERQLVSILERIVINRPDELARRLPSDLEEPFTVRELAEKAKLNPRLAAKMTYCLTEMGVLQIVGKRGRSRLFTR